MDNTTKSLLAAIALGLFVNALSNAVPVALAAERVECRIDGPVEVRVTSINDDIEVKRAFGQVGTSSSNPVYIKALE